MCVCGTHSLVQILSASLGNLSAILHGGLRDHGVVHQLLGCYHGRSRELGRPAEREREINDPHSFVRGSYSSHLVSWKRGALGGGALAGTP